MNESCPVCTRDPRTPYVVKDSRGHVVQGCVDKCHGSHLILDAYASWYNRKEAKAIRANLKKMRCK
jgi:hypothetical protein